MSLSLSASQKDIALADPTRAYLLMPAEYVPTVINALTDSIRETFLFGLSCMVVSGVLFYFIPWTPLALRKSRQIPRICLTPKDIICRREKYFKARLGEADHWMG